MSMHKEEDKTTMKLELVRGDGPKEPSDIAVKEAKKDTPQTVNVAPPAPPMPQDKPDLSAKVAEKVSTPPPASWQSVSAPAVGMALAGDMPDIVFAIPSMRRFKKDGTPAPENYLKPLVDGIWDSATPEQRTHIQFLLYNVDKEPEKHAELIGLKDHPNLEILVKSQKTDVAANMVGSDGKIMIQKTGKDASEVSATTMNWIAGETADAPFLIKEAAQRAPYVVFLEDDVKATGMVVPKLYDFMTKLGVSGRKDWLMVDLYTPDVYWGPREAYNMERYDFECCTQAMLFRSNKLGELLAYEHAHPNLPVDDNIRDFVRSRPDEYPVLAMVPNPFEHVGRYSSNPEKSTGVEEHKSLYFEP
jgi:hypothetical protein